jgi:hypothetical protein
MKRNIQSPKKIGWFRWIWMVASAGLVVLLLRFIDRLLERIKT